MSKRFIRNGEQRLPKTTVETRISESDASDEPAKTLKPPEPEDKVEICPVDVPASNFIKCVEKRIEKVEKLAVKPLKSKTDLTKSERCILNDKITKNVLNYPFDKKLYKELISLQLNDKPAQILQPISTNYEPLIRDKVPKLEDFYIPFQQTEFNIATVPTLTQTQSIVRNYDGLRMHKLTMNWNNDQIYP